MTTTQLHEGVNELKPNITYEKGGELSYEGRTAKEIVIHQGEQVYDLSHQAPAWERIAVYLTDKRQIRVVYYQNGRGSKFSDYYPESAWVEIEAI